MQEPGFMCELSTPFRMCATFDWARLTRLLRRQYVGIHPSTADQLNNRPPTPKLRFNLAQNLSKYLAFIYMFLNARYNVEKYKIRAPEWRCRDLVLCCRQESIMPDSGVGGTERQIIHP